VVDVVDVIVVIVLQQINPATISHDDNNPKQQHQQQQFNPTSSFIFPFFLLCDSDGTTPDPTIRLGWQAELSLVL
jgi:hypothetical protein